MISPGQYKARALEDTVELGETERGNLQLTVDMDVKDSSGQSIGTMTTSLYFSPEAAKYSYERLWALGWKGKGADDIGKKMPGISTNDVDVRVTQPENYKTSDGSTKMGTSKLEILTGTGKFTPAKSLDEATFRARLKAIGGGTGSSSSSGDGPPAAPKGEPPPF